MKNTIFEKIRNGLSTPRTVIEELSNGKKVSKRLTNLALKDIEYVIGVFNKVEEKFFQSRKVKTSTKSHKSS